MIRPHTCKTCLHGWHCMERSRMYVCRDYQCRKEVRDAGTQKISGTSQMRSAERQH